MKLFIAVPFVMFMVSGCQTNQTQAQHEYAHYKKTTDDSKVATDSCYKALLDTDDGKIVSSQIFTTGTGSNRYELLASKEKLNDHQKDSLKIYSQGRLQCREIAISASYKVSVNEVNALLNWLAKSDAVVLALLKDEFTIGDANVALEKGLKEFRAEKLAAFALDKQRWEAMDRDEYARRQQAAAIMLPYMMQQQQIQVQQQQSFYNQQMQQIQNNRPVNTVCTNVGNQINCTTR